MSDERSTENQAAREQLTETFYLQLRGIADALLVSERTGHTLQPTALLNEACVRMLKHGLPPLPREQQLAIGARVLRQVLVDHARSRSALKRRPDPLRVEVGDGGADSGTISADIERLHGAIEKLRKLHERQSEVLLLRVFGGLTMEQVATAIGVSKRTAEGDWAVARAWLRRELSADKGERGGE